MFDSTKPNIILFADTTSTLHMMKSLGAYKVAYTLRQAGYEVAVINHLSIFTVKELLSLLNGLINENTLFVGVSNFFYADVGKIEVLPSGTTTMPDCDLGCIIPHGKSFNQIIKDTIKTANPNCKLVLGGPAARDAEDHKDFDYVVLGYAEMSVVNLADHLYKKTKLEKTYKSIFGPVIVNDPKADGYDFSTAHMYYEDHDVVLSNEVLNIEVGRGCIFNCSFCAFPLNGKKKSTYIRHRDLLVKEMLDNYNRFGVTSYKFIDDTFNETPEKCQLILDVARKLPFELRYWAFIRLDLLTSKPETIDMLVKSGCRGMFFGIETFHPEAAKAIRKGGSREKQIETLRYIKEKYGNKVSLHGAFIYGLPYEPLDSLEKTTDFLLDPNSPLDTWNLQPLLIRTAPTIFLSDIDKNYEKYGYKNLGLMEPKKRKRITELDRAHNLIVWENEYSNYYDMRQLVEDVVERSPINKTSIISSNMVFAQCSLGLDIDEYLFKPFNEYNWPLIDHIKMRRATEYKRLIFERLGVKVPSNSMSFADQLKKYKRFTHFLWDNDFRLLV